MKRRLIVAALGIAALLTGAFAAPFQPASGPTISRITVNDSFTQYVCGDPGPGFMMKTQATGTAVIHRFAGKNGDFEKYIITQPRMRMKFTNLDTGESVWTPTVSMTMQQKNAAGKVTLKMETGLKWRIIVRGEGIVTGEVGRIVWRYVYDDDGNFIDSDIVFSAGIQDGNVAPVLCEVLG